MIPRNLFGMALSVLPKQQAVLYRWQGRQTNAVGLDVDSYAPGEKFYGSIQAVDRARYERLGLDAAKSYIMVFTDTLINDLTRKNPDRIGWGGEFYEVLNRSDWIVQANFNGVMAVCTGPDTETEVESGS